MNYTIYQIYFGNGTVITHQVYTNGNDRVIPNNAQDVTNFTAAGGVIVNKAGDAYVTINNNVVTINTVQYQADQATAAAALAAQQASDAQKTADIIANLPSWAAIANAFDALTTNTNAATTVAQFKPILLSMIAYNKQVARVVYWLAKNSQT